MAIFNRRKPVALAAALVAAGVGLLSCTAEPRSEPAPTALGSVPAVRLNYRYEADVPPPSGESTATAEQRDEGVQLDFDNSRPQEILNRTIASPDKKHIVAVYQRVTDLPSEFRLDMYSPEGTPVRKLTADMMAVHFPETIRWSPDSNSLAFVAMLRTQRPEETQELSPPPSGDGSSEGNTAIETPVETPAGSTMPAPTGILTFRTEQLYICNADGTGVRPLTQNEGLIYYYYAWSPDSTMLIAMATTAREWKYFEALSIGKGEIHVPQGRPRLVEKNGRERRLDDNQTSILPAWSPDSTKVAVAFDVEVADAQNTVRRRRDTQIRIYDATANAPTQAAIPLRNQLLISSAAHDRGLHRLESSNSVPEGSPSPEQPSQLSTLPDESELVSYNPIVELAWPSPDLVYFKTAYVKRMMRETDNVTSFARWHRLVLSAQPQGTPK